MKEINAIIRMNMVNKTATNLKKAGFPCFTCRKVLGRGKKMVDLNVSNGEISINVHQAENLSEQHRLISKRLFTIMVNDQDVQEVVDVIISTNQTHNPGDGKIFVTKVTDVVRIRTSEKGALAL